LLLLVSVALFQILLSAERCNREKIELKVLLFCSLVEVCTFSLLEVNVVTENKTVVPINSEANPVINLSER
jgi:hypothetical protein